MAAKKADDFDDRFQVRSGFDGTVMLHHWFRAKDGQQYDVLAGNIRVLAANVVVGFDLLTDKNANWVALIVGETDQITIAGCQVMGVTACDLSSITYEASRTIYRVP